MQIRILDDDGEEVPADGETMGELQVRSPGWPTATTTDPRKTSSPLPRTASPRTGDIATRDEMGYIDIVDRDKDVIKSGGVDLVGATREQN